MIYVLHGQDDYSIRKALSDIKARIAAPELLEANTTVLQGTRITLEELIFICNTTPFLSNKRLVIVEELLSALEERTSRRRGRGVSSTISVLRSRWKGLREYLEGMPDSTDLVFVDGPLSRNNPLFSEIAPLGRVLAFPFLSGEELRRWIRDRIALEGARITTQALRLLAELVGGNLWILDGEIQKLCLYKGGEVIQEKDVHNLVAPAREVGIFAGIDSIMDNKTAIATRIFYQLLQSGVNVSYILIMLARQVRLIILAKELKALRLSEAEMAKRLGISPGFPLRKTLEQEGRFSLERLKEFYHQLLEADLSIKSGVLEDSTAIELLIMRLSLTRRVGTKATRDSLLA